MAELLSRLINMFFSKKCTLTKGDQFIKKIGYTVRRNKKNISP